MRWSGLALVATLLVAATAAPVVTALSSPGTAAPTSVEMETTGTGVSPTNRTDDPPQHATIRTVYPNPVRAGDRGEFVVVSFPRDANLSRWSLADDDGRSSLGNGTVAGRVALTRHPSAAANLTDAPVRAVQLPALANAGERVRLVHENATVDEVGYTDAPEGELRRSGGAWRPLGATDRPVVHTGPTTARAFVLPDAPHVPLGFLRNASDRLLVAGYTFTSRRATRALVAASRRGVDVRVLVDGGPVGGVSRRQGKLLDRLVEAGVEVRVLGGPHARYDFHHPKYAVADDRALVLTENWKPAGTGGRSSRGWGVVLPDRDAADALAATFRADAGWRDARPWSTVRDEVAFEPAQPANGSYPSRVEPERVPVRNASVLVAPDNAEAAVVARIDGANRAVRVLQPTVGGVDQPFVRATVRAARRGVDVKLLLSSTWYAREENRRLADRLHALASREDLPLAVRLAEPRGRFEKVHAKGVLIDGETVVVGSLNWNNNSARANREVLVVLESEAAAAYYGRVYRSDWRGAAWNLPLGLAAVVLLGVAVALAAGRGIDFSSGPRTPGR